MKAVAIVALLLILTLVLLLSMDKEMRSNPSLVYRVLGWHKDGEGKIIYTVEVGDNYNSKNASICNIPASECETHPLTNNRWNLVPQEDMHVYRKYADMR